MGMGIVGPRNEISYRLKRIRGLVEALYQPCLRTGQAGEILFNDLFEEIDSLKHVTMQQEMTARKYQHSPRVT